MQALRLEVAGESRPELVFGSGGAIVLDYEAEAEVAAVQVSIGLFASTGEGAGFLGSEVVGTSLGVAPAQGSLRCAFKRLPLLPGSYRVNLFVTAAGEIADWVQDAATVEVAEGDFFGSGKVPAPGYGSVAIRHEWSVQRR